MAITITEMALEELDTVFVAGRDAFVVLRDVSWADYKRVLKIRGDKASPRINYVEGQLEIMSPGESHETIKSALGRLVEVYCAERAIEFQPIGSWTLKLKAEKLGIEPDECYTLGDRAGKHVRVPDLAIEVVWTSGGIDKLAAYAKLRVREVWYWKKGALTPYVRKGKTYVSTPRSRALPALDLTLLASFAERRPTSKAMREYRAALAVEKTP
jgi:Uma2 family endonuclease